MTGPLRDLRIRADGLWSRYGFENGNPFEFEDASSPDGGEHADWLLLRKAMRARQRHLLLDLLVRRHLVPAIVLATGEAPELEYVVTSNNPVRDVRLSSRGKGAMPADWHGINVTIPRGQVLSAANEMGFDWERGPMAIQKIKI